MIHMDGVRVPTQNMLPLAAGLKVRPSDGSELCIVAQAMDIIQVVRLRNLNTGRQYSIALLHLDSMPVGKESIFFTLYCFLSGH